MVYSLLLSVLFTYSLFVLMIYVEFIFVVFRKDKTLYNYILVHKGMLSLGDNRSVCICFQVCVLNDSSALYSADAKVFISIQKISCIFICKFLVKYLYSWYFECKEGIFFKKAELFLSNIIN